MNYSVDYFINKFEAIPEKNFTTGDFKDPYEDDKKCALGHCFSNDLIDKIIDAGFIDTDSDIQSSAYKPSKEEIETTFAESYNLCKIFNRVAGEGSKAVIRINNGTDPDYQQPNPKARILAALYDIKNTTI